MKTDFNQRPDDGSKRAKNIAAILYLVIMVFLVGGSYWHQHQDAPAKASSESLAAP